MWILSHWNIPNKYLHNEQPHRSICIKSIQVGCNVLLPVRYNIKRGKIHFHFLQIKSQLKWTETSKWYLFISCSHRSICDIITYSCLFRVLLFPIHWTRPSAWSMTPLVHRKQIQGNSLTDLFLFSVITSLCVMLFFFSFCCSRMPVHYIFLSTILSQSRHICLFH